MMMMVRLVPVVAVAAVMLLPTSLNARAQTPRDVHAGACHTTQCLKRVRKRRAVHRVFPFCNTWRCISRVRRKHERREWRYYRSHPMPYCTWGPESGGNYRARNASSTAGGKFQIIDGTWYAFGGSVYADSHPAAAAPPLEQERVARRILSDSISHWVNC